MKSGPRGHLAFGHASQVSIQRTCGGSDTLISSGRDPLRCLLSEYAIPLGCVKDHLPDREIQVQDQERVRTPEANQQRCQGSLERSLAY